MKRFLIAGAAALALTACGQHNTKSEAAVIADVCDAAKVADSFAVALDTQGKLAPKAKADWIAAKAILFPQAPAAPLCNANPYPTSLSDADLANLIAQAAILAGVIK